MRAPDPTRGTTALLAAHYGGGGDGTTHGDGRNDGAGDTRSLLVQQAAACGLPRANSGAATTMAAAIACVRIWSLLSDVAGVKPMSATRSQSTRENPEKGGEVEDCKCGR